MTRRALVVDDTKLIRDVFSQQLVACGCESKACASLADTLKIIQEWQPDVVMLDLRMAGHDGFEVIKQILAQFPDPPKIVAVSGAVCHEVRTQTEEAGFCDFLQKPFRVAQIKVLLEKLFGNN